MPDIDIPARRMSEEEEDRVRLETVRRILLEYDPARVFIYPGETPPVEYHVYVENPTDPKYPVFACVLDPPLESQGEIIHAFEVWLSSLWPDLEVTLEISFPCGI